MAQRLREPGDVKRFEALAVGDQLEQRTLYGGHHLSYWLVTDLWFDPVRGQHRPYSGQMAGVAHIRPDGELSPKWGHSRHALATLGYHYAKIDYLALAKARAEALATNDNTVVGIGYANAIRRRPKAPGASW